MKKTNKKAEEKKEFYYKLFYDLYDKNYMRIGYGTWMSRIEERYYSHSPIRNLCIILQWFLDNYNVSEHKIQISAFNKRFRATIMKNDDVLESYLFGKFNNYYMPIYDMKNDKPLILNTFSKCGIKQFYYEDISL